MGTLGFLKSIKVEDPQIAKKSSGGGTRKQWSPVGSLALRIWKSGAVYPSQALVDRFNLEYGNKPAEVKAGDTADSVKGNGFDVFKSEDMPIFKSPVPLILLNVVSKGKSKVDLFGSVAFNDDGTPKVTVMEQGASTFGKDDLLPAIKAVYGVEPNEKGYVDLVLIGQDEEVAEKPFELPAGKTMCHVPKSVSRGAKAGEGTYVRREYPVLYALYPYDLLHPDDAAGNKAMDDMEKRHADALVK